MPRIRTLKPELPHDAKLKTVSRDARLTFIYLLTVADDAGYFRADVTYLRGVLYPEQRDVTEELLRGWLRSLKRIGVIELVRTSEGLVGHVVNWSKHQYIARPSRSHLAGVVKDARRAHADDMQTTEQRPATPSDGVLSPESRSPESQSKALVELRSTTPPDTTEVEARTAERRTKEQALRLAAEVVFAYWHARMGKNGRCVLDRKRESKIVARLRENGGDVSELLYAVDGALRDDYLMGRDPKAPRAYNGIETIFRDRAQVERLAQSVPKRLDRHPFLEQRPDA